MVTKEKPPMKTSDEAKKDQLEMARRQGEAYVKALKEMANKEADDGGEKRAGQYVVAYAVEKAEGMYQQKNGELRWTEPENENCHVEVSVRDAADNRFIPGLTVHVRLVDENGEEVGRHRQPFLWHPWLYHYGLNWRIPAPGAYTLRVRIEPPTFMRHDRENGRRFAEEVLVEFDGVDLEPR